MLGYVTATVTLVPAPRLLLPHKTLVTPCLTPCLALCDDIMEFAKFDDDQQEAYEAYARDLFIDDYYFTDGYVFRR